MQYSMTSDINNQTSGGQMSYLWQIFAWNEKLELSLLVFKF